MFGADGMSGGIGMSRALGSFVAAAGEQFGVKVRLTEDNFQVADNDLIMHYSASTDGSKPVAITVHPSDFFARLSPDGNGLNYELNEAAEQRIMEQLQRDLWQDHK